MKWYIPMLLAVLSASASFAQAPVHGAAGSSGSAKSTQPSGTDPGSMDSMHVKSPEQVLHDTPQLAQKLSPLLPAELTPEQACTGYKTLDQCVSAIHLAWDLKISFTDLKAATTGKHSAGLEKAATALAPKADVHAAVKKAHAEASEDLKGVSLFGF